MSEVNLDGFQDPWEHIRLLSDPTRNAALVDMLVSLAPQRVVVEVGCGTGLLSCVAARAGASRVIAVEPTLLWTHARDLVAANHLGDQVEVLPGRIQDLEPRPAGLVFSELLNADPFLEGVLDAMECAASWLGPDGIIAPNTLKVWAALIRDNSSAVEARVARDQVRQISARFNLTDAPLQDLLSNPGTYAYVTTAVELASTPVLLWSLALGTSQRPASRSAELTTTDPGPIGGVVVWFEAHYADGIVLHNAPQTGGSHWGHLVSTWPEEQGTRAGEVVKVQVHVDGGSVRVHPVLGN
jgi:hypothetical protein